MNETSDPDADRRHQEVDPGSVPLGRRARRLWTLAPGTVPLNHGSFGACPRSVQAAQARLKAGLESEPDRFFDDFVVPSSEDTPLRRTLARAAALAGCSATSLAFVENATVAIDAVLRSPRLRAGERILVTDHTYGAVALAVRDLCRDVGALMDVAHIPLAATPSEVVALIAAAMREGTRLVIVDHIASISSLVFPVRDLVRLCRRHDVPILVDGAHAAGQVPLSLEELDADWYVTNLHKWAYAPRGTCLLYAGPRVQAISRPGVVSHHIDLGFPRSFDYLGTRDYTAWLASGDGIDFHRKLGFARAATHARLILDHATARLAEIGVAPLRAEMQAVWMRAFRLPAAVPSTLDDAAKLRRHLWTRHRIQAFVHQIDRELVLRVSAPPYVDREDVEALVAVLRSEGWPGGRTARTGAVGVDPDRVRAGDGAPADGVVIGREGRHDRNGEQESTGMNDASANKAAVEKVAAAWSAGTGDVFDIVSKDVVWTLVSSGDAGRTYHGLEAFFAGAFGPLRDRYASKMRPEIRGIYADGDVVVLRWNGAADLVDGQTYRNRYVFVMTMQDGLAVRVEEFCDIATYEAAKAGAAMPPWQQEG